MTREIRGRGGFRARNVASLGYWYLHCLGGISGREGFLFVFLGMRAQGAGEVVME